MFLSFKLFSGTPSAASLVLTLFVWPMTGESVMGIGDSLCLCLPGQVSQ